MISQNPNHTYPSTSFSKSHITKESSRLSALLMISYWYQIKLLGIVSIYNNILFYYSYFYTFLCIKSIHLYCSYLMSTPSDISNCHTQLCHKVEDSLHQLLKVPRVLAMCLPRASSPSSLVVFSLVVFVVVIFFVVVCAAFYNVWTWKFHTFFILNIQI